MDKVKRKEIKKALGKETMAKFQLPYYESFMLQRCLLFISVLSQFGRTKVMMDYVIGKFASPDLVGVSGEELGLFYAELIPAIEPGKLPKSCFETAQDKLWKVVTKHDEPFVLEGSLYKPRLCSEWNDIVMSLASNKSYWLYKPYVNSFAEKNIPGSLTSKSSSTENINVQKATTNNSCNKSSATEVINTRSIGVNAVKELKDSAVQGSKYIETSANVLLIHNEHISKIKQKPIEKNNLEIINNNIFSYPNTSAKSNMSCNFCLKTNHVEEDCWRKRGLCLICGGKHRLVNCTKNSNLLERNLNCPLCHKSHLGNLCRLNSNTNNCNWCGKRGHSARVCRMRLGACYFCGDLNHLILDCARHGRKQKESTDYWWDPSV